MDALGVGIVLIDDGLYERHPILGGVAVGSDSPHLRPIDSVGRSNPSWTRDIQ